MHKVLFTNCPLTEEEIVCLRKEAIEIIPAGKDLKDNELLELLKECEIVIVNGNEYYSEEILCQCPHLKVIQYYGIGYTACVNLEVALKYGKMVFNTPKVNSYSVAEFSLGLLLALNQKILLNNENTRKGIWQEQSFFDLKDRTIGILGMGHIGTYFAEIMYHAFHTKILFYDILEKEDIQIKYQADKVSLERIFKESDIVSVHLPLTSETKSLIGKKELDSMKSSAYLINTARAEIIDFEALYDTLIHDRIAGCAFDGFYEEPIDLQSEKAKILQLPNGKFLLTPHTGYNALEGNERVKMMCLNNIREYIKTGTSKNIVK